METKIKKEMPYGEQLSKCKLSKTTQGFLSCILLLSDLLDRVYEALEEMYEEHQADEIIDGKYSDITMKLEKLLFSFVYQSISEHIYMNDFESI